MAPKKEKKFWETTQAKIAGILAVIAFIVTAATQLEQSFVSLRNIVRKYLPSKGVEVSTKYFKKLPSSLKNSLPQKEDLVYWYHVSVDNRRPDAVQLKLDYAVHNGPARGADSYPQTVGRHQHREWSENPALEILTYDDRHSLEITWSINDAVTGEHLRSETATILLLPRDVVAWDLQDPDGKHVSQDFLLASLTAWTINQTAVKDHAAQLLKKVDSSLDPDSYARVWFRECYNKFFKGSPGLKIVHSLNSFPPHGEQEIRLPGELLKANRADPIEGALLLGALSNTISGDLRANMVIFVLPDTDEPNNKSVLFSWSMTRGNDWHALDLSHSSRLSFEENEKGATSQVAALLKREPDILERLNNTGTFLKEGTNTVALDLDRASKHFEIQGLP